MPYRLLIVDDDTDLLSILGDIFREENYAVTLCSDGSEAIQRCQSSFFDLIITDIMLPGASGIDILREVKRNRPETTLMSNSVEGHDLSKGLAAVGRASILGGHVTGAFRSRVKAPALPHDMYITIGCNHGDRKLTGIDNTLATTGGSLNRPHYDCVLKRLGSIDRANQDNTIRIGETGPAYIESPIVCPPPP